MLSNPPNGLHARQRQHSRQNSTPLAFDGVKMSNLLNSQQQFHRQQQPVGHRRGLSLDTRRRPCSSRQQQQDFSVSTNTNNNTGLANQPQHHVLRETQPHSIQARPGTAQQHPFGSLTASSSAAGSENYLISPHATPSSSQQRFDHPSSCFDPSNSNSSSPSPSSSSAPFDPYGADDVSTAMMIQKSQAAYGSNMAATKDFDNMFHADSSLSTPTFMNFQDASSPSSSQGWISEGDTSSTRRSSSSRRISNGIMDRVSKFENMGFQGLQQQQRPITPPNQNGNGYFPPTPTDTPHGRVAKHDDGARSRRFAEDYDESMEETIKPTRNNGHQRAQSIFQDMRRQSDHHISVSVPSPPGSSTIPAAETFGSLPMQSPDFLGMNGFNSEFLKMESSFDREDASLDNMAPSTPQMTQFINNAAFDEQRQDFGCHSSSLASTPAQTPSRHCHSPRPHGHRRTESLASIASAASIASINIEETKTDTGVTLEDISQYIQGPDTADGKWMCLYDDCGKKFGRKENIKSHVQTHLNDRQYQCPTCHKCFVRQHDLKRHAKIHTGIKPYPCECGNSFARHDALTRHRQRGMCIGAFDGVVRKVVKRGRPKKNRPDMDARLDKSARQRRKNNMSISSASSQSGYSDCSSVVNSPDNDYNMLDDMMDIGLHPHPHHHHHQNLASSSSAPMLALVSAPALSDVASSPSSYVSPEAIMERTPSHASYAPSPARSIGSRYTASPAFSGASSPPSSRFFDTEATATGANELTAMPSSSSMMSTASMPSTMSVGIAQHDDNDILLQFTNEDGLSQLDRDPSMLIMSKFDEEFDNAVGIFNNSDDVFFGSV